MKTIYPLDRRGREIEHKPQWDSYGSSADEASLTLQGQQVFQHLLRERIIFLGQQVDDEIANRICGEMLLLSAEDRERDIRLYINSPGGSVTAGMAIYDIMQFVPNDVVTLSMGHDRWFTAQEAKDYGLVDHVVRSAAQVPTEGAVS